MEVRTFLVCATINPIGCVAKYSLLQVNEENVSFHHIVSLLKVLILMYNV